MLTFPASYLNSRPAAGRHPSVPGEKPVIGWQNQANCAVEQGTGPGSIQHLWHSFRKIKEKSHHEPSNENSGLIHVHEIHGQS